MREFANGSLYKNAFSSVFNTLIRWFSAQLKWKTDASHPSKTKWAHSPRSKFKPKGSSCKTQNTGLEPAMTPKVTARSFSTPIKMINISDAVKGLFKSKMSVNRNKQHFHMWWDVLIFLLLSDQQFKILLIMKKNSKSSLFRIWNFLNPSSKLIGQLINLRNWAFD